MTYRKLELSNYVSARTRQASESDAGILLKAKGRTSEIKLIAILRYYVARIASNSCNEVLLMKAPARAH
jgi:hypothetical protein